MVTQSSVKLIWLAVEGENTRLRHDLARLKRKSLCYSQDEEILKHSIRLLIHAPQILGRSHSIFK